MRWSNIAYCLPICYENIENCVIYLIHRRKKQYYIMGREFINEIQTPIASEINKLDLLSHG